MERAENISQQVVLYLSWENTLTQQISNFKWREFK